VKRVNCFRHLPSSRQRYRRSLMKQIRREAGLDRLGRDNARLNMRFSLTEWIQLAALVLLMLLAMGIGAYLMHNFKGVIIDD
jgi:hypothetical protein